MALTTVLLSSFPGLDLPRTLSLPVPSTITHADLHHRISSYLPASLSTQDLLLTTTSSARLLPTSQRLSALTGNQHDQKSSFLPLQLRPRTLGGKGGFGSQLRAAGGRMSSSKKKKQQQAPNSNRNLDGRRMRTIEEAKKLTEYLAVKPEMEKKEREERYKRWTAIVEGAEQKERDMREGKGRRGDGRWIEVKEDAEKSVREAVARGLIMMEEDDDASKGEGKSSDESAEASEQSGSDSAADAAKGGEVQPDSKEVMKNVADGKGKAKKVWGWDEDDDDDTSADDEDDED